MEGKIVKLLEFGAFVELKPGLDGLVHISQISDKHIAKPSDVLSINEKVKVKILDINKEEKRISLSIIEAEKKEDESIQQYGNENESVKIGDVVENLEDNSQNKES